MLQLPCLVRLSCVRYLWQPVTEEVTVVCRLLVCVACPGENDVIPADVYCMPAARWALRIRCIIEFSQQLCDVGIVISLTRWRKAQFGEERFSTLCQDDTEESRLPKPALPFREFRKGKRGDAGRAEKEDHTGGSSLDNLSKGSGGEWNKVALF